MPGIVGRRACRDEGGGLWIPGIENKQLLRNRGEEDVIEALAEGDDVWDRGYACGCGAGELSERTQGDIQGAESGAIGLAQATARSAGKALQGPGAGSGTRDPGEILGACAVQHVHGPGLVLQTADLDERSGGTSGMRQMPHRRIAGMGGCVEEEQPRQPGQGQEPET